MATTILTCPSCKEDSRTVRTLAPSARVRCGKCGAVSRCFVHGNGAVELRPIVEAERPAIVLPGGTLPPRIADPEFKRTTLTTRKASGPIGGYGAFGKGRSYVANFAGIALVALVVFVAYWYCSQIRTIQKASGRSGGNAFKIIEDARRAEFRERQKKALAALGGRS